MQPAYRKVHWRPSLSLPGQRRGKMLHFPGTRPKNRMPSAKPIQNWLMKVSDPKAPTEQHLAEAYAFFRQRAGQWLPGPVGNARTGRTCRMAPSHTLPSQFKDDTDTPLSQRGDMLAVSLVKYPRLWGKLCGRFGKTRAASAMLSGCFMPGPGRWECLIPRQPQPGGRDGRLAIAA